MCRCVNVPFAHGYPAKRGLGGGSFGDLSDLTRPLVCQPSKQNVNTILRIADAFRSAKVTYLLLLIALSYRFNFDKDVFTHAYDETLFTAARSTIQSPSALPIQESPMRTLVSASRYMWTGSNPIRALNIGRSSSATAEELRHSTHSVCH